MKIIAIEGPDGYGKSTIARMLSEKTGYKLIKFPNETLYSGELIRKMLTGKEKLRPDVFQQLQNINKEITIKNLPNGTYIFDRYKLSEIVYGLANGLKEVNVMNLADCLPDPDITFIFVGKSYKLDNDVFGNDKYQDRIAKLFKRVGKTAGGNIIYVNNEKPIDAVFNEIFERGKL